MRAAALVVALLVSGVCGQAFAATCGTGCSIGLDDDCDGLSDLDEGLLGTSSVNCDTDNDGIRDDVEVGTVLMPNDSDGDGTIDARDNDSDNDAIADKDEARCDGVCTTPADDDHDGTPNHRDVDSDGDTVSDADEAGDTLLATPAVDTDSDETPDYLDLDSDGDGMLDATETGDSSVATDPVDTDGDGVPNYRDANDRDGPRGDYDGDGVANTTDNCPALPNADQVDVNTDGIGDLCESTVGATDTDEDGVSDLDDNCPLNANADQADADGDAIGDACDPSDDRPGQPRTPTDATDPTDPSEPEPTDPNEPTDPAAPSAPDAEVPISEQQPTMAFGSGPVSCAAMDGSGLAQIVAVLVLAWRRRLAALLVGALGSVSAIAHAEDGFDARSSRPTLFTQGAAILPRAVADTPFNFTLGVYNDFARTPLRFQTASGSAVAIRSQTTTDLQLRVDLPYRLTVAADLPFIVNRSLGPWELGSSTLGDAQLGLRVTAFKGAWANLAAYVGSRLPTGDARAMTGATGAEPELGVIGDATFGRVAAVGTLGYRDVRATFAGQAQPNQIVYSGGASVRLVDTVSAFAYVTGASATDRTESPLEAQLGARASFGHVSAFAALGVGISTGAGVPDWRGLAGIAFAVRTAKADKPEFHASAPIASIAMPSDQDNDGVIDAIDQCVSVRETPNSFKDDDGCPDERPEITFDAGKPVFVPDLVFLDRTTDLDPLADEALARIVRSLAVQPNVHLVVVGYGADAKLAVAQARVVMERLVELGVPQDHVTFAQGASASKGARIELVSE